MNFKQINNDLEKKGYHVVKNFLSKKLCEKLDEQINQVIKTTNKVEKKADYITKVLLWHTICKIKI